MPERSRSGLSIGGRASRAGLALALALLAVLESGAVPVSDSAAAGPASASGGAPGIFDSGLQVRSSGGPRRAAEATPPARLLIPVIGVAADVERVGLDSSGSIGVPTAVTEVGWFDLSPRPGEPGDAILDGHLDWYTGPAVFVHLDRLRPGDDLYIVGADGSTLHFQVESAAAYPYDATPPGLFSHDGASRLTLITCAGSWDRARGIYLERLLVRAALVA